MKKIVITACVALQVINVAQAQIFNDILNQGKDVINNVGGGNAANTIKTVTGGVLGNGLSNTDIITGLREALSVGTNNSTGAASKLDGYLKNPAIKIPFPKDAALMEQKLRALGMGKQCDALVTSLNRAAEKAAVDAAPIFLNAIKGITINDGLSILNGGDNAATNFLKTGTNAELKAKFMPIIKAALVKVNATKYWNPLFTRYNKIPMVQKVNPNLDAYVTDKAIEGLFKLVAVEETKIRKDPSARVSDILKKVFGS